MEDKFEIGEPLEFQIIRNILSNRVFLVSVVEHLYPEFFDNTTARVSANVIKDYFTKYADVPTFDIIKEESKNYLTPKDDIALFESELENIRNLNVENEEYIKSKVMEHCQFSALKKAILSSASLLSERPEDYKSKIGENIKKALSIAEQTNLGLNYFVNPELRIVNEMRYKKYIKTGIPSLDRITGGGWSAEDTTLSIVVASTGIGKSIFLCKFGSIAILHGHKVLHVTHELSESRTAARYDALLTKIGMSQRLARKDDLLKKIGVVKSMTGGENLRIKEFPTKTCSTNQIRAYVDKLKQNEGFEPEIIINDYLDLMVANFNAYKEDDYAAQKRVSEELRALSQELQIPIVTASQTNRGASDKDIISGGDIAESFGKTMTTDLMMTINQTFKEKLDNKCNLYIAKYRNGPSGLMIPLNINYEMMNVTQIEEAKPTETQPVGKEGGDAGKVSEVQS